MPLAPAAAKTLSDAAFPVAATVILLVVVLALLALFTMAEVALARTSHAAAEDLAEAGRKRAGMVEEMVENRREVITSSRNLRVFLQALTVVGVTLIVTQLIDLVAVAGLVALLIGALLLVAVISPATYYGRRNPSGVIAILAPLPHLAQSVGAPFRKLGSHWRLEAPPTDQELRDEVAEDLREMVDQIGDTESFEAEDREMVWSVFELGQTLVREVMVPRTDMVSVEMDVSAGEALALFVQSGYSRVPVIGEDTDDIRGVLYLKDVLGRIHRQPEAADMPVHNIMREAKFVPEMKLVDDLLREMQVQRFHMALVVDEYGGIAGLVTLEDVVEELIGEVSDEHDHNTAAPEEVVAGLWRVPAKLGLAELGDIFDMELEDDDVDSVGGLLAKLLGKVPLVGEEAAAEGLVFRAVEADGRRRQVSTIEVWRDEPEEAEADDE